MPRNLRDTLLARPQGGVSYRLGWVACGAEPRSLHPDNALQPDKARAVRVGYDSHEVNQ